MQKLGYYLKCEEALYEDDIQSGVQFFNRPRMADIITLLKSTKPLNPKPYEAIFVDDVSRIARNIAFGAMFVQALRFHKIKLFDARGSEFTSTVGYTSFLLLSVCAETERVWVSERTSRGMRAAAQRKILSGKVYGFKRAGTKIES